VERSPLRVGELDLGAKVDLSELVPEISIDAPVAFDPSTLHDIDTNGSPS
jgi:hypothetical protein